MLICEDIKWLLIASVGVNTLLIHSLSAEQTCLSQDTGKDAVQTATYVAEEERSTGRSPAHPGSEGCVWWVRPPAWADGTTMRDAACYKTSEHKILSLAAAKAVVCHLHSGRETTITAA